MNSGLLEDLPTLSRSVCIVYNKVTVRSPNEESKVSSNKKRYSRANCAKEIGGRPMTSSTPPRWRAEPIADNPVETNQALDSLGSEAGR